MQHIAQPAHITQVGNGKIRTQFQKVCLNTAGAWGHNRFPCLGGIRDHYFPSALKFKKLFST